MNYARFLLCVQHKKEKQIKKDYLVRMCGYFLLYLLMKKQFKFLLFVSKNT